MGVILTFYAHACRGIQINTGLATLHIVIQGEVRDERESQHVLHIIMTHILSTMHISLVTRP